MALTESQIDRYSRQIIVPGFGGAAQERLLKASLELAGDTDQIEPAFSYLVGAGIGRVHLRAFGADPANLIARANSLNPDTRVSLGSMDRAPALTLVIAGSDAPLSLIRTSWRLSYPAILARLDHPGLIAILSPPPCLRCASGDLTHPFGSLADRAALIAIAAAAEAIKFLAGYEPAPRSSIIEFRGYQTAARSLEPLSESPLCACSHRS